MNIIYNSDLNGVISDDNKLLFNISEDMQHFKNKTKGTQDKPSILIVGYNTYLTLPNIANNYRTLWVLTNKILDNTDTVKFYKYDMLIEDYKLLKNKYNWWIIGGKQIYELFELLADTIYHTQIDSIFLRYNPIIYKHPSYYKLIEEEIYNDVLDKTTNIKYTMKIHTYINKFNKSDYYNLIKTNNPEYQYLDILYKTLNADIRPTRNGNTLSYFGDQLRFDLTTGFPLLTTKKMFLKGIILELLFFIKGNTNTKELEKEGVNIWTGNTSRKFLDNNGFKDYQEGEIGPMYGYQWRHFNDNIDQLHNLLNELKTNPTSRRLLMTTYNPEQVNKGVLYPCHSLITQFYVEQSQSNQNIYYVSMNMYQRSADVFLGLPFNIASSSLLLEIICHYLTHTTDKVYLAKDLVISLGDVHLYEQHTQQALDQLRRTPLNKCKLNIVNHHKNIEDYTFEDFKLENYYSYPVIKADMVP